MSNTSTRPIRKYRLVQVKNDEDNNKTNVQQQGPLMITELPSELQDKALRVWNLIESEVDLDQDGHLLYNGPPLWVLHFNLCSRVRIHT